MFQEYKVINGILHTRGTPRGEWREMSAKQITAHYEDSEKSLRARLDNSINASLRDRQALKEIAVVINNL